MLKIKWNIVQYTFYYLNKCLLGSHNLVSKRTFTKMNKQVELLSKWIYTTLGLITPVSTTFPALFKTLFNFYTSNTPKCAYVLPFFSMYVSKSRSIFQWNCIYRFFFLTSYYRFPIDWRTPFGYTIAFIFQFFGAWYICLTASNFIIILAATCWILATFIKETSNNLRVLNVCETSDVGRSKVKKCFCDIIQAYANIRQ